MSNPATYKDRVEQLILGVHHFGYNVAVHELDPSDQGFDTYKEQTDVDEATAQLLALMDEFGSEVIGQDVLVLDEIETNISQAGNLLHNKIKAEARTRKEKLLS